MARKNPYYTGPVSDHFDGDRFFNPGQHRAGHSLVEVLRWRWQTRHERAPWPTRVAVEPTCPAPRVDGLRAIPVGHASVLLQVGGRNLLTDPVWSDRAGPLPGIGPTRVAAPGIRLADLPPIDAVLLSHNHYDHFDVATLRILQHDHAPLFVVPLGNDTLLRRHLPDARILCGDWGRRFDIAAGLTIDLVPAWHWSARGLRDRRAALWCGFVIRNERHAIYYVGDTGYGDGTPFRDVRTLAPELDLALIPIGAYQPRWFMQDAHVDPHEAVRIFADCGARRALGVHWGTFRLSDEAYDAPPEALRDALDHAGIDPARFVAARPGQAIDIA